MRRAILNGDLSPSQRIVQEEIARQYGTSRIPVREVIRELASEGLVSIEPDVGARVTPIDPAEIVEIYRMREALEPLAAAQSALSATPSDLARIQELLAACEAAWREGDFERFFALDRDFHLAIREVAHMPSLSRVVDTLWNIAYRYRRQFAMLPHQVENSIVEHRMLVDALTRHSPEDAAQLQQIHIRRARLTISERAESAKKTTAIKGPSRTRKAHAPEDIG